jgi:FtsP/CotA-like multicopper oxidase with cupredoxin domain
MSRLPAFIPRALGVAFVLLVTSMPIAAEPLRDITIPLCSSVDADFASGPPVMSPNCAAPVVDGHRDTLEISLTAARGETRIGDFVITDAYLYNDSYAREVWSVDPGDNILITIENALSGVAGLRTNLHTHGFIVSPNNAPGTPESPIGDNVFVDIKGAGTDAPGHHAPGPGDVPVLHFDKVATAFIEVPADHPKGLYWYHPHPHGISDPQMIGGMSGLITIGQASDYVSLPAGDARSRKFS